MWSWKHRHTENQTTHGINSFRYGSSWKTSLGTCLSWYQSLINRQSLAFRVSNHEVQYTNSICVLTVFSIQGVMPFLRFSILTNNYKVLKHYYLSPLCSGVSPPCPQLGQLFSPNPWQSKHLCKCTLKKVEII